MAVAALTVGACEQNFPLSGCSADWVPIRRPTTRDESDAAPEEDQNSLLPRWLPDASGGGGWVAKVRADPGRAGAIALAVVAALAVLVTVFTVMRDRPAPVMSAKLPPVRAGLIGEPQIVGQPERRRRTGRWWSAWSAWCTSPDWSP